MPLECFYTIPSSIENRRIIWRIDQQLLHHINRCATQLDPSAQLDKQTLETEIARYLFEQLQQHPLNKLYRRHWIAFLQRSCEKVAYKIMWLLPAHLRFDYFSDLFLIACQTTIDPVKFLAGFNRQLLSDYWYPTLKRFTQEKIKYFLLPQVREITQIKTLGRSNLALVARSTRQRVKEALRNSDYQIQLSQYLLAWQCFQEVRSGVAVNQMTLNHFQLMAERYNQLQENPNVNGEQIKAWLENIGSAIRQLLEIPTISLDVLIKQGEENASFIEPASPASIDIEELGELKQEIERLINKLKSQFEPKYQILFLYYALELTQTEVGAELGLRQDQICHRLQSIYNQILPQISDWVRQNINVEPSSEGLSEIKSLLGSYCTAIIDRFWDSSIVSLPQMRIAPWEPLVYLYDRLTRQIEQHIELKLDKKGCAIAKIPLLVEQRLNESGMHSFSQHLD